MASKKTLEYMRDKMDLNIYESKVYTALLSRGIASAGELADISGVPRSRCYDVLESLEKKGFVFMKVGKPIRYIAIEPSEAVEHLKKKARMDKNHKLALFDELSKSDTFNDLKELYSTGRSHFSVDDVSSLITGKQNINLFMKEMFARASKNITIHTDDPERKLKILKKSKSKTKAELYSGKKPSKLLSSVSYSEFNPTINIVHADDETLLFTSNGDSESAVWLKSNFASETIKSLMQ